MHDCAKVDQELAELRKRVAELESLLGDAVRSHATPAWVKAKHRKLRPKTPGAREGHEPHQRESKPPDEEKHATLTHCPDCQTRLGRPLGVRGRTVEELVPAHLKTTQWWVHRYWCPGCRTRIEAPVPGVLSDQRFGLKLMLYVVSLRTLGLPFDKIQRHLRDSFRLRLSHGAIVHMEDVVAQALGPAYHRLLAELRRGRSVHGDDTGWRVDGVNHWLWVLLNKTVAWFTVQDTRSRTVIEDALGPDFDGVVTTDFYPSFKHLAYAQQKCLVHLLREIKRFEAKPDFAPHPEWKRVRMRVKRLVTEAVEGHERLKDPRARSALKARLIQRALAVSRLPREHKYARTLARLVGDYHASLFTFLDHPGVHWENNPAERGLRPMVVNRKMSHGSRSLWGAQRRAITQSIAETGRLRGQSLFEFAPGQIGLPKP